MIRNGQKGEAMGWCKILTTKRTWGLSPKTHGCKEMSLEPGDGRLHIVLCLNRKYTEMGHFILEAGQDRSCFTLLVNFNGRQSSGRQTIWATAIWATTSGRLGDTMQLGHLGDRWQMTHFGSRDNKLYKVKGKVLRRRRVRQQQVRVEAARTLAEICSRRDSCL